MGFSTRTPQRLARNAEPTTSNPRVKACGTYKTVKNTATVDTKTIRIACNVWRECSTCAEKRALEWQVKARRANLDTLFSTPDGDVARKMKRRIRDHGCKRIATKNMDGMFYIYHNDPREDGEVRGDLSVDELVRILNVREGTAICSNLTKEKKRGTTAATSIIETSAPSDVEAASFREAYELKERNPQTLEEAEKELYEINREYVKIIKRKGYHVKSFVKVYITVDTDEVTWVPPWERSFVLPTGNSGD